MNDGRNWSERIDRVLADPAALEEAAALHFTITQHLAYHCVHKRACPERVLYDEALSIVGLAKKERAAAAAASFGQGVDHGMAMIERERGDPRGICACGEPALDGHLTCGRALCLEGLARETRTLDAFRRDLAGGLTFQQTRAYTCAKCGRTYSDGVVLSDRCLCGAPVEPPGRAHHGQP